MMGGEQSLRVLAEMLAKPTPSGRERFSEAESAAFETRKKAEYQAEVEGEIRRKRMARVERTLRENGLNQQVERLTFANFQVTDPWQEAMKRTAEEYARHPSGWLLLSGQSGCGKTHLCTAVAGELLQRGIPVLYMLWRQDSPRLKPSDSVDEAERERAVRWHQSVECLYIDDLFKGVRISAQSITGVSAADIKLAFEILDSRYRTNRLTLLSTELTPDQLTRVDEAVAGRIFEKCRGHRLCIRPDAAKNLRLAGKGGRE